jgi:uncharacterized protein YraI
MNRRRAFKLFAGAGAAALAAAALPLSELGGVREASATGGMYRTTTSLNLRSKPSTSAKVILVMPKGAAVEYLSESKNGFMKVAYQGTSGWAYADYLEVTNGGSDDPPVVLGYAVTTSSVNFRSGPSTGHDILKVLAKGTQVEYTDLERYGFRYVVYKGQGGWIYEDYLSFGGSGNDDYPADFKTLSSVNLRAEPNTNAKVITTVPAGAIVTDYDGVMANGFRGVDYKGKVGWIYDAYLARQ